MNKISLTKKFNLSTPSFISLINNFKNNNKIKKEIFDNTKNEFYYIIDNLSEQEMNSIDYTTEFNHLNFSIDTHYTQEFLDNANYFTINNIAQFNYLNLAYEEILKNFSQSETFLPNIYSLQEGILVKKFRETFNRKENWILLNSNFINTFTNKNLVKDYMNEIPFYINVQFDSHDIKTNSFINFLKQNNILDKFYEKYFDESKQINTLNSINDTTTNSSILYKNLQLGSFFQQDIVSKINIQQKFIDFLINKRINLQEYGLKLENYTEVLGYKILKYEGQSANDNSTPLQTIFIPIQENISNYIDTQIFYDKNYNYKIYAIVFALKNKFIFEKKVKFENAGIQDIALKHEFMPEFYEIKTGESFLKLLLNPPLPPEIEILPNSGEFAKNTRTDIKFNFSISRGTINKKPITWTKEQQDDIFKRINSLKTPVPTEEKINFENNKDYIKEIHIWKTTEEPTTYNVFSKIPSIDDHLRNKNDYATILSLLPATASGDAEESFFTSFSFKDSNLPTNTKFYYIFKCKSYKGHYSYPTDIYELEFLEDNGNIYPSIKIYDMQASLEKFHSTTSSFRRFICVEPAALQKSIDYMNTSITNFNENTGYFKGLKLGVLKESTWDKRFKLRFISKSTHKKIDIIIKFSYKLGPK